MTLDWYVAGAKWVLSKLNLEQRDRFVNDVFNDMNLQHIYLYMPEMALEFWLLNDRG